MNRSLILSLSEDLHFSLTEEEIQDIQRDFAWVQSIQDQFAQIDVSNVEPMISCVEFFEQDLRPDQANPCLGKEQVLQNAKKIKEDKILVNQVVRSSCDLETR